MENDLYKNNTFVKKNYSLTVQNYLPRQHNICFTYFPFNPITAPFYSTTSYLYGPQLFKQIYNQMTVIILQVVRSHKSVWCVLAVFTKSIFKTKQPSLSRKWKNYFLCSMKAMHNTSNEINFLMSRFV